MGDFFADEYGEFINTPLVYDMSICNKGYLIMEYIPLKNAFQTFIKENLKN